MRFSLLILFFCAALAPMPGSVFAGDTAAAVSPSDDDILRGALWTRLVLSKPPNRPTVGLALSGGVNKVLAETGGEKK